MKPHLSKSIRNNLRFLFVEISIQLSNLQHTFDKNESNDVATVKGREGYTSNLKSRIHNACHRQMLKSADNPLKLGSYRSILNVAANLERISELSHECQTHAGDVFPLYQDNSFECSSLLAQIADAIALIEQICLKRNSEDVIKIGQIQRELHGQCQARTEQYRAILKSSAQTDAWLSALMIINIINQMGIVVLKTGEAILSGRVGQSITIDRYHSLADFVAHLSKGYRQESFFVETVAETRSGSAISGIGRANKEDILAIFKEGKKNKLKGELESIEKWHDIYPGIAPKILSYRKQGQSAALLIEHLQGMTFEKIVMQGSRKLQIKALKQLLKTLHSIWSNTRKDQVVCADFTGQLQKRLPAVYALHPEFEQACCCIAGIKIASFSQLLVQAKQLEQALVAPFSVYIHGDFNSDNIMFNPTNSNINFIDLHRSRYMDYIQDISVFMVSNYRLQALDQQHRQQIAYINHKLYEFASEFAGRNHDIHFELRLCLGLIRSLATSPRFTVDKTLAKSMFYRARYLLEQIVNLKSGQRKKYRVPIKEIFVG